MTSTREVTEKQPRAWSLRREWSRAFNIMVVLLLVAASMAIVGVWGVVDQVAGSAKQLRRESALIAVLQTDIVNHEEVGHKLLSDEAVNRSAYIRMKRSTARPTSERSRRSPGGSPRRRRSSRLRTACGPRSSVPPGRGSVA